MKKTRSSRMISFLLVLCMLFSLTACSTSKQEQTSVAASEETTVAATTVAETQPETTAPETEAQVEDKGTLLMATTTSTDNTGLLDPSPYGFPNTEDGCRAGDPSAQTDKPVLPCRFVNGRQYDLIQLGGNGNVIILNFSDIHILRLLSSAPNAFCAAHDKVWT